MLTLKLIGFNIRTDEEIITETICAIFCFHTLQRDADVIKFLIGHRSEFALFAIETSMSSVLFYLLFVYEHRGWFTVVDSIVT